MTLLDSLLDAIIRLQGDALVMHVGEKPYVVTTSSVMNSYRGPLAWGQVELSSRPLTPDAVLGMLAQILPEDQRRMLDDLGAVEYELPAPDEGDPFLVTAARGGEDIWVEVRRKPQPVEVVAEPIVASAVEPPVVSSAEPSVVSLVEPPVVSLVEPPVVSLVEPPVVSAVEPPVVSPVEPPVVGLVEPPVVSPVEPPVAEPQPEPMPALAEEEAPAEPAVAEPESQEVAAPHATDVEEEPGLPAVASEPEFEVVAEEQVFEIGAEAPELEIVSGEPELEIVAQEPLFEVATQQPGLEAAAAAPDVEVVAEVPKLEIVAEEPAFEVVAEEPDFEVVAQEPEAAQFEEAAEQGEPLATPQPIAAYSEPDWVVEAEDELRPPAAAAEETVHDVDMSEGLGRSPGSTPFEIVSERPAVEFAAEPALVPGEADPAFQLLASDPAIEVVEEPSPDVVPAPTVVPIAKPALKLQPPPPPVPAPAASTEATLVGLLRAAAARGASTVYAVADSRPMIRLDGEIALLGTEAAITAAEVDRFTFEFAPRDHVAEVTPEWTCAVKGIGRVRCVTFHDDSGTGLIVHLPSPNVSTADEIGLEARIQALCGEADGLVVIAGPRGSGKSTLLDAFVDLINRTRYDHVITIESHIKTTHEKRHSFISQRQSNPDGEAIAAAARAALREGPDVLVIEDLRAPEALSVALDAARAGRLVFGGIAAPTASAAVERLVGAFPADRRPQVRALVATSMRAVVAQVLVRNPNGGRIGARELLLNSPAVEKLILDGSLAQLPLAIEGGRRLGMVTMNDALGALVRHGVVEIGEVCRVAPDRAALLAALERDGIDISSVERRA